MEALELRSFHPEDLLEFVLAPQQAFVRAHLDDEEVRESFYHPETTFTLLSGGMPVASFGALPLTEGRGWLWAFLDLRLGAAGVAQTGLCARRLIGYMLKHRYHRVEAYIVPEFREAVRFAEFVGLRYEGPIHHPDGLRDYDLYARWQQ